MQNVRRNILFLVLTMIGILIVLVRLEYLGIIWHNDLFSSMYQVKGLDVSNHQGDIDWKKVRDTHKYSFVYMKATEGHDFFDDFFKDNWREVRENGFLVGAYHFFSIRSSGKTQAELFISHVPKEEDALPPVIDIEIDTTKDPFVIRNEIQSMASTLEEYYGKKPILYCMYSTYDAYIKDHFMEYDIWIRDIVKPPFLGNRAWVFWQYTNRGRVDGIDGYVDINVFHGNRKELNSLIKM